MDGVFNYTCVGFPDPIEMSQMVELKSSHSKVEKVQNIQIQCTCPYPNIGLKWHTKFFCHVRKVECTSNDTALGISWVKEYALLAIYIFL